MKNECDCVYMRRRSWPFVNVRLVRYNFRKRWHASLVCRFSFASCLLFSCLKPYIPSLAWHSAISLSWVKSQTKDIKIKTKESQARRLEKKQLWVVFTTDFKYVHHLLGKGMFSCRLIFLCIQPRLPIKYVSYFIGPWNLFVCGLLRPKIFFCLFFVCSNRVLVNQRVHRCCVSQLTINTLVFCHTVELSMSIGFDSFLIFARFDLITAWSLHEGHSK